MSSLNNILYRPDDSYAITTYFGTLTSANGVIGAMTSGSFDIGNWFKNDPLEAFLDLKIYPVIVPQYPSATLYNRNVKFGKFDTGVTMHEFAGANANGSCQIKSTTISFGGATDFSDLEPYTDIKLFLPFIGFVDIAPSMVRGKTVTITYYVNYITGEIVCYLSCDSKIFKTVSGHFGMSIPITRTNAQEKIQTRLITAANAVMTVGASAAAIAATGGSGAALIPSAAGAAQSVINSFLIPDKISVSGSFTGMWGDLAQPVKPYAIITRSQFVASSFTYKALNGVPSGASTTLSTLTGYTEVEKVHVEGFVCTSAEAEEIEQLLKSGVIF